MPLKALIHKQGFNLTTLADIAQEANVPLGNVYYYFKTKESIAEAVIANRGRELHEALQIWEKGHRLKNVYWRMYNLKLIMLILPYKVAVQLVGFVKNWLNKEAL